MKNKKSKNDLFQEVRLIDLNLDAIENDNKIVIFKAININNIDDIFNIVRRDEKYIKHNVKAFNGIIFYDHEADEFIIKIDRGDLPDMDSYYENIDLPTIDKLYPCMYDVNDGYPSCANLLFDNVILVEVKDVSEHPRYKDILNDFNIIKIEGEKVEYHKGYISIGCTDVENETVRHIAQNLID